MNILIKIKMPTFKKTTENTLKNCLYFSHWILPFSTQAIQGTKNLAQQQFLGKTVQIVTCCYYYITTYPQLLCQITGTC